MSYIEAVELVGIAAFAVCGAMPAIDKGADVFGVLFLAVVTALGGGVIRDMMLGYLPPRMFTSYTYIVVALITSFIVFLDAYKRRESYEHHKAKLDSIANVFDALGLAVFTVSGVNMSIDQCGMDKPLLLILLGMTTGVGGGMLRDVLTNTMPAVLRKRIYAIASMSGALLYYVMLRLEINEVFSALTAMGLIFALRILATVYKWNLPKVKL